MISKMMNQTTKTNIISQVLMDKYTVNHHFGVICLSISCARSVLYLLFGVLPIYWALLLFYAFFLEYSLSYVMYTIFCKNYYSINLYQSTRIITGNRVQVVPEAVLHTVCAICGILPIVLFHDEEDLYQLLLQIVLFPMFCYIVSIVCTLILKQYSSVIFSAIVLLILFYR